ncbi:PilZ domain-containing protein [Desulfobacula sp.]|uniref:PilZ domain-containing protein n=1 Tax=Desulfobacula sp. TaxID=2593537 RepID=UPI0025BA290F|nr:PilZ domain-containing protein [Desulfobacula sp.]MBC2704566.1 PilZ domain-containing protein [Desulfobacula sp.]
MPAHHEQRQHERFEPQNSAFVVFRPEFNKIGPINDISKGGLGFNYLQSEDKDNPASENPCTIDIFDSSNSFHLSHIPCSLIYDTDNNDQLTVMHNLANRRCGLKFDQLTKEQEEQITFFLTHHTVGNA